MENQLTQEFAETVRLPLNPRRRTAEVMAILLDPAMTGEYDIAIDDQSIVCKPRDLESFEKVYRTEKGYSLGHGGSYLPHRSFIGRKVLRQVATCLEGYDQVRKRVLI